MKNVEKHISKVLAKHKQGAVVMLELPAENYFETGADFIKLLANKGFRGLYVSFQRPYQNVASLLKDKGVSLDKFLFVHACTVPGEKPDPRCTCVPMDSGIDEFAKAIYTNLSRLKGKKKFIFVDSLTTIVLYKQLSEFMRFSEFLIREVKNNDKQVLLLFNVAKDVAQKKFIKDVALKADEVIVV